MPRGGKGYPRRLHRPHEPVEGPPLHPHVLHEILEGHPETMLLQVPEQLEGVLEAYLEGAGGAASHGLVLSLEV